MLCQGEGVSPRLIDTHKNRTSVQTVALFYCHQKIFDIEHFLQDFIYMRNKKKKKKLFMHLKVSILLKVKLEKKVLITVIE